MRIVIMGCGRVGSSLAMNLEAQGHQVAIVDQVEQAFRRLGPDFRGDRVTGVGFDRDTLVSAGIEGAGAFAAVSSGDNSNIIAARVARETFGVENVVARIYDPKRAEVYQRLGIPTVATVNWTADQMLRRLLPEGSAAEWRDATGSIAIAEVHLHPGWIGRTVTAVEKASRTRVAFLTRLGEGLIPRADTVIQEGDLVHLARQMDDADFVDDVLGSAPGPGGQ